jgi:SAM-dependent methyltransferase
VTTPSAAQHLAEAVPGQPDRKPRWHFPADFLKIDGVHVPVDAAGRAFDYSDGDETEIFIHQAIRWARDCSSSSLELEEYITDWPSEYHLSRHRANLLRPFALHEYKSVLEIGGGCGAITRYLGETCAQVTALEGSRRRAAILRDRCRDLANVTCISANLEDVHFSQPFDLIVVIGVLEYAGKYFASRGNPYAGFLKLAARALGPNGLLVLAIENQLGLKYFQSDPEVNNRSSGLEASFFLPFPDYKLPRLILNGAAAHEGLRLSQWYDRQKNGVSFSDTLVLQALENNGLLADFANSFLILASKRENAIPACPWGATYYSLNRKRCYQTQTRLQKTPDGYVVSKTRLFLMPENRDQASSVRQVVGTSPHVSGEKLSLAMLRALRHEGVESRKGFELLLSAWNKFLVNRAVLKTGRHDAILPADCVDCTPFNLILTKTGLKEFDQEWILEREKVTVGWVLFRGLYWFLVCYSPHIRSWRLTPGNWSRFLRQQFARLGYPLSRRDLLDLARQELRFQQAILLWPEADQLARTIIAPFSPTSHTLRKGLIIAKRGWRFCRLLVSAARNRWRRYTQRTY